MKYQHYILDTHIWKKQLSITDFACLLLEKIEMFKMHISRICRMKSHKLWSNRCRVSHDMEKECFDFSSVTKLSFSFIFRLNEVWRGNSLVALLYHLKEYV